MERRPLAGKTTAIMPYSVFVEVVAAVRRRTGSEELAREVGKQLLRLETAFFVAVDDKAAREAAELALSCCSSLVYNVTRELQPSCRCLSFRGL